MAEQSMPGVIRRGSQAPQVHRDLRCGLWLHRAMHLQGRTKPCGQLRTWEFHPLHERAAPAGFLSSHHLGNDQATRTPSCAGSRWQLKQAWRLPKVPRLPVVKEPLNPQVPLTGAVALPPGSGEKESEAWHRHPRWHRHGSSPHTTPASPPSRQCATCP